MLADLGAVQVFAEGQHGLITSAQARAFGIDRSQLERYEAANVLRRVFDTGDVYAFTATTPDTAQHWAAACLLTGGYLHARAAVRYWELRGQQEGATELVVPYGRSPENDAFRVHRTRALDERDVVDCGDGIRVTSVARTLLDFAAFVSYERLEAAIFDALRRGLVTFADLADVAIRLGGKGRTGIAKFRRFLDENDPEAALPESELEVRMLRLLRAAGLDGFVPQFVVAGYRLDFPFPDVQLDVETDGQAFHTSPADRRRDKARDATLRALGWIVRRFTWFDVVRRPDWVIAEIRRELTVLGALAS